MVVTGIAVVLAKVVWPSVMVVVEVVTIVEYVTVEVIVLSEAVQCLTA